MKRWIYVTPEDFETAKKNGIHEKLVKTRVYRDGWEINRAITQKVTSKAYEPWERWKDKAVVTKEIMYYRLEKSSYNWSEEEAALTPKGYYVKGHKKKIQLTADQLKKMEENGVTKRMLNYRVNKMGLTIDKAISLPKISRQDRGRIRKGTLKIV